jgi:hypothetical protein
LQLDSELKTSSFLESPLAFTILDEANLSAIEHYWASFYNLSDRIPTYNSPLSVNLGGNQLVTFSNCLRFIATINFDHTTEELSPRILDRANIIKLDNPTIDIANNNEQFVENLHLTYKETCKLFNLPDFASATTSLSQLNITVESKLNEIKKVLPLLRIPLSPRAETAIRNYCLVARHIMTEELRPLDYCVAQRILPKIRLHGDTYLKLLEELKAIIDTFGITDSLSSNILSQIIKSGTNEGYAQNYFWYFNIG